MEGTITALLVGPRPYVVAWARDEGEEDTIEHRLFAGLVSWDGVRSIRSVTESGARPYTAIGRVLDPEPDRDRPRPSEIVASAAAPVAFHPAGHQLLWRDGAGCYSLARYSSAWSGSTPVKELPCGEDAVFAPNGAVVATWDRGKGGVMLHDPLVAPRRVLGELSFRSCPRFAPDGRGLVGVVEERGVEVLVYAPVDVPLADVANAWMFVQSEDDRSRFASEGGLLRKTRHEQLYELYETELYTCDSYDPSLVSRPYLVTTDVFWELVAAAFEGTFIVRERHRAMPAFWELVARLPGAVSSERLRGIAAALAAVRAGDRSNPEAARILDARGTADSPLLGVPFDYGELRPRGHYAMEGGPGAYFRSFRYLTRVELTAAELAELGRLPEELHALARDWIAPYAAFVGPPRSPVIWGASEVASHARHPIAEPRLFPLSWGFDNEALDSVVFHQAWPPEEQVVGKDGPRLLPTGLDLASAFGSGYARGLLRASGELASYPRLDAVLSSLAARRPGPEPDDTLYERWLHALALQWADDVAPVSGEPERLWRAKRLQTGLASWATLRHATILVNERGEAECGEAGFEPIMLDPPRGYVEPDPATFDAIAELLEAHARLVQGDPLLAELQVPDPDDYTPEAALEEGLVRRLGASAAKARLFASMARKQAEGKPLAPSEYEEILYVARAAEHNFKVLKSLSRQDMGLWHPDPVAKVADVYGGSGSGLLLAGVGEPLEWDQIVPSGGRRQIVRGAVYAYHETVADEPMDDEAWRAALDGIERPGWIARFVTDDVIACPPADPFAPRR